MSRKKLTFLKVPKSYRGFGRRRHRRGLATFDRPRFGRHRVRYDVGYGASGREHSVDATHHLGIAERSTAQANEGLTQGHCVTAVLGLVGAFRNLGRVQGHVDSLGHDWDRSDFDARVDRVFHQANEALSRFETVCLRKRGKKSR